MSCEKNKHHKNCNKYYDIYSCGNCEIAKVDLLVESNNDMLTFIIRNTGTQTLCKEFKIYSSSIDSFTICKILILPGEDYTINKIISLNNTLEKHDKSYVVAKVTENDWVKSKLIKTNYNVTGYELISRINITYNDGSSTAQIAVNTFNLSLASEPAKDLILFLPFPEDPLINSSNVIPLDVYPNVTINDKGITINVGDLDPGENSTLYVFRYFYVRNIYSGIAVTWSMFATTSNYSINPQTNYIVETLY